MIEWDDSYQMGIEAFDSAHRQLFKVSEQILEKLRARGEEGSTRLFLVREGLNYLEGYFANHAAQEEAYMRSIQFEGYALHKMLHDDFQRNQMAKYQRIVDSGACSKEDAWDFIGSGIGWLLEHITTADMAIVGKGFLCRPVPRQADLSTLEREVNQLLTATLNIEANAKIVSTQYAGESIGKAVCQRFVYRLGDQESTVISGIERSFLLDVARRLYGSGVEDEMDLVLSTLETFSASFWLTLSRQLTGIQEKIDIRESRFLMAGDLPEALRHLDPTYSILFTSAKGKFFVAANSKSLGLLLGQPD